MNSYILCFLISSLSNGGMQEPLRIPAVHPPIISNAHFLMEFSPLMKIKTATPITTASTALPFN